MSTIHPDSPNLLHGLEQLDEASDPASEEGAVPNDEVFAASHPLLMNILWAGSVVALLALLGLMGIGKTLSILFRLL